MKGRYAFWVGLLVVVSFTANAQTSVTPESEYKKLINVDQNIQPLGANPFGENISLYDGTLSFEQTDVTIPGTGPALQLGRLFVIQDHPSYTLNALRPFGDWELDIPRIETFAGSANATAAPIWQVQGGSTARCSSFGVPPVYSQQGYDPWTPSQWWYGYHLMIPGQGSQNLLSRNSQTNTLSPSISGLTFPIVTKQNWMIHCGVTASDGGEGFVAIAPDGTQYTFAYLIYRPMTTITSPYGTTPAAVSSKVGVTPQVSQNNILFRRDALMMVTKVQDRFGNTLTYNYTGNNLTSIVASDGRQLTFQYGNTSAGQLVTSVTATAANASPRVWTYTYDTTSASQSPTLTGLALPDASTWSFNLGSLEAPETYTEGGDCTGDVYATLDPGSASGSMTHPSGLTGTFVTKAMMHGRSYVPKQCFTLGTATTPTYSTYPEVFYQYSIVSKQFSGAGLPTRTWTYNYSAPNQSWSTAACASDNTCATTVYTDVVDPEGNDVRTTFSNRYDSTEGLLLQTDYFTSSNTSAILRSVVNSYASPTGGPWPTAYGFDLQARNNQSQTTELSPLSQRVTSDNGDTYTWLAEAFNAYAQVTKTKRYNSISYEPSIEEQMSYVNDTAYWVLGLPQEVDNLSTGETESLNTYAPIDTLQTRSRFGQLLMSYTFDGQGNLSTYKDGNNNVTTLSNYYRGIPQTISYPDNATEPLSVDDFAQIQSITDQNGNTTSYSYDAAGRVNGISYPANDEVSWYPTTITYNFVGSERGISGNHWRRTRTTGDYQEFTYFDAMLQPILTDSNFTSGGAVVSGSDITVEKQYDSKGQTLFTSYPVQAAPNDGDSSIASGTHNTYDALGRVSQSQQDSELGTLTTSVAYSAGARKLITDPNGNVTANAYQVFDQPAYDTLIQVAAPQGLTQNIGRDLYGNATVIVQFGAYGNENQSVTKSLYYDSFHRLCRFTEPETGDTVTTYDGANNVQTTATGLTISGTECGTSPAASQTAYTYDAMNRVLTIQPPAGTQSTTYTYDPMGHVASASSGISYWWAHYDKLGHITGEALWLTGQNAWGIGYGHDPYGHVSLIQYPSGESVGYAPNPRGQDTMAGSYVNTIGYYADGTMENATLGNGITRLVNESTRLLPNNLTYSKGGNPIFSEDYAYDKNANLTGVGDLVNSQNSQALSYDGLNRLISASAPNAWGNQTYTYDPLNRLRQYVNGYTFSINFDANSRLASITVGSNTFSTYTNDPLGNRQTSTYGGTTTNYSFDAKNQLLAVTGTESYAYDAAGRRVMKTPASGGAASADYTFYSHTGQLMMGYSAATGLFTNYIYLNGQLIARHVGSTTTYLLTDRLGTPVRETDANGNVTASFSYEPFGLHYSGPTQGGPGFTGHENDPESGFTYMQARYYDPGVGEFLSVDPVAPTPGDVFNFSRYAYASNNPVANVDPNGRQSTYDAGVWAGAAVMAQQSPQQVQRLTEQNVAQAKIVVATVAASATSPAAGFVAKTALAVASDSLAAGSLTVGIMANGSAVVASGSIVAEGVAAANGAPSGPLSAEDGFTLNAAQSSNLARFNKGLPSGNLGTDVDQLGGGVVFSSTVPGKVPGSSAVYQKTVDGQGSTTGFLKTTFAPNGDVVHVKDKINNTTIQ